jgi:hypothetical protein
VSRLYYAFLEQESDRRIRAVWELNLQMELAHLQLACDLLRRFEGREPAEVVGADLPEPPGFEADRAFLRRLLATHLDTDALESSSIEEVAQVRDVRERLDHSAITGRAAEVVDVVDVLTDQHSRIDALFHEIEVATGDRLRACLDELARRIPAHEAAEEAVHQLAHDLVPGGVDLTRDVLNEEREIMRMVVGLADVPADREEFEERVANLRDAVRSHFGQEKRTEFPELRERAPVGQLHELADEARCLSDGRS